MNNQNIQIIKQPVFNPFESRMVLCADPVIKIGDKEKIARLAISMVDTSVLQLGDDLEKLNKMAVDALHDGVQENFEIDGVYYFEYTGSHFQQLDEKPDWASDFYRQEGAAN
ncbi:MAG: hypothetical protein WAV15_00745 [Minisyncoccia bacterium]